MSAETLSTWRQGAWTLVDQVRQCGGRSVDITALLADALNPGDLGLASAEGRLVEGRALSQLRHEAARLASHLESFAPTERAIATNDLFDRLLSDDPSRFPAAGSGIEELLVRLVVGGQSPPDDSTWYDPACGTGGTATVAALVVGPGTSTFRGQDVSGEMLELARRRALLSSTPIESFQGDTLKTDGFPDTRASFLVCVPPFGGRMSPNTDGWFGADWPEFDSVRDTETWFLRIALEKLRGPDHGGGTAAIVLRPNQLSRHSSRALLARLLEDGVLRGFVVLPAGLLSGLTVAVNALVISNAENRSPSAIRVVDARGVFANASRNTQGGGRKLTSAQAQTIAEQYWAGRDSQFARTVPVKRLRFRQFFLARNENSIADRNEPPGTFTAELPDSPEALASLQSGSHPQLQETKPSEIGYRLAIDNIMGPVFEDKRAYSQQFHGELVCLGQVAVMAAMVNSVEEIDHWDDNSLLVTRWGRRILRQPPEGDRFVGIHLKLDPQYCDNEFVALILEGSIGEVLFPPDTSGPLASAITRHSLLAAQIPLPSLESQAATVAKWNDLDILRRGVDELQSSLQSDYRRRSEIEDEVAALREASSLESWLATLPYPFASAIWAYRSMSSAGDRLDQLIKAFESTAEFLATVLLSAIAGDPELKAETYPSLSSELLKNNHSLERPSFGTWNTIVTLISKRFRSMIRLDAESRERCLRAFKTSDDKFVNELTDPNLGTLLQKVAGQRNRWTGHGGIRSDRESARRIDELMSSLSELQKLMLHTWRRVSLVAPGPSEFKAGSYQYSVRNLTGLTVPFETVRIDLRAPMEADRLHLYSDGASAALELLPILQMGPAPETSANSFYFYNRLDSPDEIRMVSYHHQDSPEVTVAVPGIEEFIRSVSASPTGLEAE